MVVRLYLPQLTILGLLVIVGLISMVVPIGNESRRKKMVTVKATLRTEDFGSAGSRRLVRNGFVPAEMYGKDGNLHVYLNAHDFELQLRKLGKGMKCEVELDGKIYNCIFKELQENVMTGTLIHADFQIV